MRLGAWLAGVGFVSSLGAAACTEDVSCREQAGWVCPIAGTTEQGFNREGLAALESDLFLVSAARRGPDGRVYVMDFNNQRLRRIEDDGKLRTIAGNGFHAFADVSVPALDSPLENPVDFGFAPDGTVVFVSAHDPRVLRLNPQGWLEPIAGAVDGIEAVRGDEGDGGPASEALFMQLEGIAVAPDGTIYVSDAEAHRVRRIADGIIHTVAGNGEAGFDGDGGPGVDASLNGPSALALDQAGNLYIADTFNDVVRRLALDGTIDTVAGTGVSGFDGDGASALGAQLDQPYGVAVGSRGELYIGDRGNFRVRCVEPDGQIQTVAGRGEEGLVHDGGWATDVRLGYVARVSADGDGVLIADQSNAQILRLDRRM